MTQSAFAGCRTDARCRKHGGQDDFYLMQSISFKAQPASSKKAFDNLSILWGDLIPVRRPIPTGAI